MPKVSGVFLPFLEMNPPFLTPSLRATWIFWTSVQESQVARKMETSMGGGGLPCIFAPSEAGLPLLLLGLLDRWASMASSSKGKPAPDDRAPYPRLLAAYSPAGEYGK